jgi:hypothetical protein
MAPARAGSPALSARLANDDALDASDPSGGRWTLKIAFTRAPAPVMR